jgi:hypothetical protein
MEWMRNEAGVGGLDGWVEERYLQYTNLTLLYMCWSNRSKAVELFVYEVEIKADQSNFPATDTSTQSK